MKNYFCSVSKGVNADLYRHTMEQKILETRISELEMKVSEDPTDNLSITFLRTYRKLLNEIMDSRASVVSKIGHK